jgi:peptidoglycan/LPS O-acetylase OafA/YrhL
MILKKTTIKILAVLAILIHITFYSIYAFELKVNDKAMDIFYAFGFHLFVLISAIIFYFKVDSKWVRVLSTYAFWFSIVCLGAFVLMGLIYGKSYFYYKAALLLSVPLSIICLLIARIAKLKKNAFSNTISGR